MGIGGLRLNVWAGANQTKPTSSIIPSWSTAREGYRKRNV
jgi:hypothetical protein